MLYNSQNWTKKGLLYCPSGEISWSKTHAQVPLAESRKDSSIRVYFSTRDQLGKTRPAFVDLNSKDLTVIQISQKPLLELGKLGEFDDSGVMPSWVIDHGGKKYMYYIGWNERKSTPYHNSIGIAVSEDNGDTWEKMFNGPIIDRTHLEPHFCGTSCVIIDEDRVWKNWYLSCTGWISYKGKPEPRYHLKYAESTDGITWRREGIIAIDFKNESEAGIVKACVIKDNNLYRMWYSYRNLEDYRTDIKNSYRIGYAESTDGKKWIRKDELVDLDISKSGWDSNMIGYPHVLKLKDRLLMFYNGDGFGRTGFGYAELLQNKTE